MISSLRKFTIRKLKIGLVLRQQKSVLAVKTNAKAGPPMIIKRDN